MFLCLAGGVGGAKLARGFSGLIGEKVVVVVNVGDDFEHLGLYIAPDLDTVTYTLADLNNPETGWGTRDETWNFLRALERLEGPAWFKLGDQDLATHLLRTHMMKTGKTLSQATKVITSRLGIKSLIAPMSDERVRTIMNTDRGELEFQEYFVREHCAPVIRTIGFQGIESARRSAEFEDAIQSNELEAIIICPSNPYLSIEPILAISNTRSVLKARRVPTVAVSPIIGGEALKGPASKIMRELGINPSSQAIADHYGDLLDGIVIDERDAAEQQSLRDLGLDVLVAPTIMRSTDDMTNLAEKVALFARLLAARQTGARMEPWSR